MRDGECDPALGEHPLVRGSVDRTGIQHGRVDPVAQCLFEAVIGELEPPLPPTRLRFFDARDDIQTLLEHQLVVQLVQSVQPGGVPLDRLTRQVVVVQREDVRVPVARGGVVVHDDHVVGGMHPLGEFDRDVADALHVLLHAHVELFRVESQHVGVELDRPPVHSREELRSLDEIRGSSVALAGHRERVSSRSRLPRLDEPHLALAIVPVEDVGDRAGGIGRRTNRDRAHRCVRSPRAARVSSRAASTASRRGVSVTSPRFTD